MGNAKDIILRPISSTLANDLVRRVHYSGKVVNNSQLHIGVYFNGKLEGAMQFGPSLDKRKIQGLVKGTNWNDFLELNRMAFSDALPRNSESRAISIAMRMLKKHAPHVQWVISFADGAQCGDGAIYRASGFMLTGIKKNDQIWEAPQGARFSRTSLTDNHSPGQKAAALRLSRVTATKGNHIKESGGATMKHYIDAGFRPIPGFQLRYIFFIDPTARQRLTVPIIPFTEIERQGAGMYKGQKRAGSADSGTSGIQPEGGGATPTPALEYND